MTLARSPKQYKGVRPINPPNIIPADRAPVSTDVAYVRGDIWQDHTNLASYQYNGGGVWIALGTGATGGVVTITASSGGALSPLAGNISIVGTANQITTAGSGHTVTLTLPAAITAPGSLTTTSTLASGTTLAAGTSLSVATTAVIGTGLTVTAGGAAITGTTTINNSGAGVTTIGTGGTGAVNIGNATGNTAVTGSLTASTSLTATLGNITATNGNLVLTAAGNKMVRTSVGTTTAAGANSIGSVTLVAGTATIATTSIATGSLVQLWRQSVGSTGANPIGILSIGTITNGTSFVINSIDPTDATALATTDVSVVGWEIIN